MNNSELATTITNLTSEINELAELLALAEKAGYSEIIQNTKSLIRARAEAIKKLLR